MYAGARPMRFVLFYLAVIAVGLFAASCVGYLIEDSQRHEECLNYALFEQSRDIRTAKYLCADSEYYND